MSITFKYEYLDSRTNEMITETTITSYEDGLTEIMQEFRHFLLAVGYHPESVDSYIEAN